MDLKGSQPALLAYMLKRKIRQPGRSMVTIRLKAVVKMGVSSMSSH